MNLSRRSLLAGLLSSAAVIAAGPVAKVIAVDDGFGVGPAMQALWINKPNAFLEGMSQSIAQTIWYGNSEVQPLRFTGFVAGGSQSPA